MKWCPERLTVEHATRSPRVSEIDRRFCRNAAAGGLRGWIERRSSERRRRVSCAGEPGSRPCAESHAFAEPRAIAEPDTLANSCAFTFANSNAFTEPSSGGSASLSPGQCLAGFLPSSDGHRDTEHYVGRCPELGSAAGHDAASRHRLPDDGLADRQADPRQIRRNGSR